MAHPTIEYSVIVAYLVLMLVVGLVFKNFNKNSGDYFRGGSQGTWWIVGMSSFMAGISASPAPRPATPLLMDDYRSGHRSGFAAGHDPMNRSAARGGCVRQVGQEYSPAHDPLLSNPSR